MSLGERLDLVAKRLSDLVQEVKMIAADYAWESRVIASPEIEKEIQQIMQQPIAASVTADVGTSHPADSPHSLPESPTPGGGESPATLAKSSNGKKTRGNWEVVGFKKASLEDDLKKYLGLPPYDGPSNIVRSDAYFLKSLDKEYGAMEVDVMICRLRGAK